MDTLIVQTLEHGSAENPLTLQENRLHPSESAVSVQCIGNELRDSCSLKKLAGRGGDF